MNMKILIKWFIWIRLYWKYNKSGMVSCVSSDIKAFGSGGKINGDTKAWRAPSEEEICQSFEQIENENINYLRWITFGVWCILIAVTWFFLPPVVIWLLSLAMDSMPPSLQEYAGIYYLNIFMEYLGGIGVITLVMVFFLSNETSLPRVTKEEAGKAAENLRLSGEIGRRPTPWWQKLSIILIVFLEAAIFGSLMISYVGDFTSTQNLIAGSVFGMILAIVLTVMTHKAGKTRYIASHRLELVKAVAQETQQIVKAQSEGALSNADMGGGKHPIMGSETFRGIREAYGPVQFDGRPLPFMKAWGVPVLTFLLVVTVAVAGYVVRDSIQNNVIDMVKRQQIEEASLRSELGMLESTAIPEEIEEDMKAGQEQQLDRFVSNEKNAARAGIIIIVITFLGLQVITTIIGYSDGFSFGENAHIHYPRWEVYEKHTKLFAEEDMGKRNQDRSDAFHRHVDTVLARYYNIAFSRTGGDGLSMPLHEALESRGAFRYKTYKEHKTSRA
uniref:Uncharacterized protein n=1 Tax=Candidatus Kentrum sp. SD TaxID=2126332 RepID=A0A450YRX4_9GAMM|nr:MAG: hypothetical protein BECKSD772F_GA0070984_11752 [Candidatus Kentron sp. SD]VFK49268.1 MAG: hypothetical protein BECKSD772E_GA0070983_11682 [Candidatus Kentron sp. SD]